MNRLIEDGGALYAFTARVESGIPIMDLVSSFLRHLRAENKKPKTLETYTGAIEQLDQFLRGQGMPAAINGLRREHVEAFIAHLLEIRSPATANNRFRGLQQFFKWAVVLGKSDKVRTVGFGTRTARALDRYLRLRASHKDSALPDLWLGIKGRLTESGIYQMIRDRGEQAGMEIHPHQLRHTFSDRWLASEGSESDLMTLAGWESPAMVRRYGAARKTERALESHKTRSLGDRF